MDQRLKLALVLDATHDDTHILTPSLLLVRNAEAFRAGRFMCVLVCEDTLNENSVFPPLCALHLQTNAEDASAQLSLCHLV